MQYGERNGSIEWINKGSTTLRCDGRSCCCWFGFVRSNDRVPFQFPIRSIIRTWHTRNADKQTHILYQYFHNRFYFPNWFGYFTAIVVLWGRISVELLEPTSCYPVVHTCCRSYTGTHKTDVVLFGSLDTMLWNACLIAIIASLVAKTFLTKSTRSTPRTIPSKITKTTTTTTTMSKFEGSSWKHQSIASNDCSITDGSTMKLMSVTFDWSVVV